MHLFDYEIQKFYGPNGHFHFEELYKQVNHQALAPFFRPWLHKEGRILDAGSGSGHLAGELGLSNACFLDITWEQIKRFLDRGAPKGLIQGDIKLLPFQDNAFDMVICSNVLHYTGLAGLKELLRVTKPDGQLLLSFLERSEFTRAAINPAVFLCIFPPLMRNAHFIALEDFAQLDIQIEDSATVGFFPPFFGILRELPRQGLVAFALRKGKRSDK